MNQCLKGHTTLKPKCQACNQIKKTWELKLTESGFKDIENANFFSDHKTTHDLNQRKNFQTTDTFEATVSYYQWARNKLSEGWFASYRDKLIWENHTEGLSRRKIAEKVGLEGSWVTRKLDRIETYLKTNSVASMSCQLVLF